MSGIELCKLMISSVLGTQKLGLTENQLKARYKETVQEDIPWFKFNCNSLEHFLMEHMADTVLCEISEYGEKLYKVRITGDTKHVLSLINRTKSKKPVRVNCYTKPKVRPFPSSAFNRKPNRFKIHDPLIRSYRKPDQSGDGYHHVPHKFNKEPSLPFLRSSINTRIDQKVHIEGKAAGDYKSQSVVPVRKPSPMKSSVFDRLGKKEKVGFEPQKILFPQKCSPVKPLVFSRLGPSVSKNDSNATSTSGIFQSQKDIKTFLKGKYEALKNSNQKFVITPDGEEALEEKFKTNDPRVEINNRRDISHDYSFHDYSADELYFNNNNSYEDNRFLAKNSSTPKPFQRNDELRSRFGSSGQFPATNATQSPVINSSSANPQIASWVKSPSSSVVQSPFINSTQEPIASWIKSPVTTVIQTFNNSFDSSVNSRVKTPVINMNQSQTTNMNQSQTTNLVRPLMTGAGHSTFSTSFDSSNNSRVKPPPLSSFNLSLNSIQSPTISSVRPSANSAAPSIINNSVQLPVRSPPINSVQPPVRSPLINSVQPPVRSPPINSVQPPVRSPPINSVQPPVRSPPINSVQPPVRSPPINFVQPAAKDSSQPSTPIGSSHNSVQNFSPSLTVSQEKVSKDEEQMVLIEEVTSVSLVQGRFLSSGKTIHFSLTNLEEINADLDYVKILLLGRKFKAAFDYNSSKCYGTLYKVSPSATFNMNLFILEETLDPPVVKASYQGKISYTVSELFSIRQNLPRAEGFEFLNDIDEPAVVRPHSPPAYDVPVVKMAIIYQVDQQARIWLDFISLGDDAKNLTVSLPKSTSKFTRQKIDDKTRVACCLKDFSYDDVEWSTESISRLKEFLRTGVKVLVKIYEQKYRGDPNIFCIDLRTFQQVSFLTECLKKEVSFKLYKRISQVCLEYGERILVTYIKAIIYFFAVPLKYVHELKIMMTKMQMFYNEIEKVAPVVPPVILEGNVYAIKSSEDNLWHRGKVERFDGKSGEALISFIDVGSYEAVTVQKNIRELPNTFRNLPMLACLMKLTGEPPLTANENSLKERILFKIFRHFPIDRSNKLSPVVLLDPFGNDSILVHY